MGVFEKLMRSKEGLYYSETAVQMLQLQEVSAHFRQFRAGPVSSLFIFFFFILFFFVGGEGGLVCILCRLRGWGGVCKNLCWGRGGGLQIFSEF